MSEKYITEMSEEELAEWLHYKYENFAKVVGWKSQESCQVAFKDLPEKNRKVMLLMAHAIQVDLAIKMTG